MVLIKNYLNQMKFIKKFMKHNRKEQVNKMPRPSQMRGGKKAKNPMKTLGRLLGLVFKNYWPLLLVVFLNLDFS